MNEIHIYFTFFIYFIKLYKKNYYKNIYTIIENKKTYKMSDTY